MNWLAENSETLSLFISAGTLLVWVTYLQVFLSSYRRQKKPMILISLGSGSELGAKCLVTNMGAATIYIHAVIVRLQGPDGTVSCPVTEIEDAEEWGGPTDLQLWSRQGPLQPGQVRDMGTLEQLIGHLRRRLREQTPDDSKLTGLELDVVGFQASEDLPVAATRGFDVEPRAGSLAILPRTVSTVQIASRSRRRQLRETLHSYLRDSSTRPPEHVLDRLSTGTPSK